MASVRRKVSAADSGIDIDAYEYNVRMSVGTGEPPETPTSPHYDDYELLSRLKTLIENALATGQYPSRTAIAALMLRPLRTAEYEALSAELRGAFRREATFADSEESQRAVIEAQTAQFDSAAFSRAVRARQSATLRRKNATVLSKNGAKAVDGDELKDDAQTREAASNGQQDEMVLYGAIGLPKRKTLSGNVKASVAVAVEQLKSPAMEGWLTKQGNNVKTWKRRWCVLKDFCLYYFKTPREIKALGMVMLPSYTIATAPTIGKRFAFLVEHAGMRTYYFYADSQEDMDRWMRAMRLAAAMKSE